MRSRRESQKAALAEGRSAGAAPPRRLEKFHRRRAQLLPLLLFCTGSVLLAPALLWAGGSVSGNLRGRVLDERGRPLANASVRLAGPFRAFSLTAAAGREGEFEFLVLPPGRYRLHVDGAGAPPAGPFLVLPGETRRVAIRLQRAGTADAASSLEDAKPLQRAWYSAGDVSSFPGPFSLWRLLQNQESSTINDPPDFGGLANTRLPLLSLEATPWTATEYSLNGLDLTDSYQPGRAVFFPAVEAFTRAGVRTGLKPASSSATGAEVRTFTRPEGRGWHGRLSSLFTSSEFASGNLSDEARAGGIRRSEQFRWFTRNHAEFAIPLGRRADFAASGTGQWASQRRPREAAAGPLNTRLQFGAADGRVALSGRDQIHAAVSGARIDRNGFGHPAAIEAFTGRRMAPPFRTGRILQEEDHLDSIQLGWTRSFASQGPGSALELRWGYGSAHLDTYNEPSLAQAEDFQSRVELVDGSFQGPAPMTNGAVRDRHQIEAVWQSRTLRAAGTRHQFIAGGGWKRSELRNRIRAPRDFHLVLSEGRPSSLVRLNTPLDSRADITNFSFHAGDRVRLTSWLSASGGVRGEWAAGSLPGQSSPAGGFRSVRSFSERNDVIDWNTWAPRAGMTLSPPGTRRVVLRASFARYYHPLAGRHLDFANPNSLSGEEFRWNDSNGDSLWQPGETGALLRRFGGEFASIDPALDRPFTDEFTISVSAELPFSLHGDLRLFRRDDKDRIAAINTGVPFLNGGDAFRPVPVLDPGTDFQEGTFDDQQLTVFEQRPATFGDDRFLLANPGLRAFSSGLVAQLRGGMERFWWRLSFTAEKGFGLTNPGNDPWENDPGVAGSLFQDPNTLVNAAGRTFFDRAFLAKLQAFYETPARWGGWEIGGVINFFDGLAFGRRLLVRGLAQGPQAVMATPRGTSEGGQRTEFNLTADLRISREFSLPAGELRSIVEVFNLPNLSKNTVEDDLSGPDFAERLPLAIQPPRYFRFGIEYRF